MDCSVSLAHVPSADTEREMFITYAAASHQRAIKMFWLHFQGAVMLFIFIYSQCFKDKMLLHWLNLIFWLKLLCWGKERWCFWSFWDVHHMPISGFRKLFIWFYDSYIMHQYTTSLFFTFWVLCCGCLPSEAWSPQLFQSQKTLCMGSRFYRGLMLVFYRKHRRLYSSHRVQGSYKVPEGLTCRADMQGVMGWRPRGGRRGLQQGGQSGRGSNEHRWRLKSLTHTTQPAGCHCMQRR